MNKFKREIPIDLGVALKLLLVLIILLLILGLNNYIFKTGSLKDWGKNPEKDLELYFFGLDKADAILLRHSNQTILIDSGELEQSTQLIRGLKKIGVKKIDYMILSHPDKDHIGGAGDIIDVFDVGEIIESSFQKTSQLQVGLDEKIKNKDINLTTAEKEYSFDIDRLRVTILPAKKTDYKKSNDNSLLTLIEHGDLKFFFAGDAEKKRLEEVLAYNLPKINLYKVPHHGKINSLSEDIIKKISPDIAVITNSTENLETLGVLELFGRYGIEVLLTGNRTVRFLSDGRSIKRW